MSVQPQRSEPLFNVPGIVAALLVVMIVVQLARSVLGDAVDTRLVAWFAFVPGRLTFAFDPVAVVKHVAALRTSTAVSARDQGLWAQIFLQRGGAAPWTILTYGLLHGGWVHWGLNGVWMVAFGTPVARRFGAGRFLALMAVSVVGGALAHWLCYPLGFAPVVGASAGISGLMGAAVRFMFQTDDRAGDVRALRPLSLVGVIKERRALSFVIVWFVSNSLFGIGAGSFGLSDAPVAWQAHVGGFLVGLLLFPWFDPVTPDAGMPDLAENTPIQSGRGLPDHEA